MRSDVRRDFDFQSAYVPHMKRLLGEALFREGDPIEDREQNTDLIVLALDGVRVGCRVRRPHYLRLYPNDFTIRSWRASGAATELEKILSGWGDYLLYGFASEKSTDRLSAARLIDLRVFREWWDWYDSEPPYRRVPNGDGSAGLAFSVSDFPGAGIVREWGFAARQAA